MSEPRSKRLDAGSLELDYPRRPRLLPGWRGWLLGGLAVGLVGVLGPCSPYGTAAFQSGPVSRPHALFGHDCGKCHERPGATLGRLVFGDGPGSVTDAACLQCHAGAPHSPPHAGPVGRCVDCHTEHRGHDALVGVADDKCVRCHGDLKGVYPDTKRAEKVTKFNRDDHPPFQARTDPGTVQFSHAGHLAEGGVLTPSRVFEKLTCANCHQTEDDGRYMKPIAYDDHCKRCHPIGANLVGDYRDQARLHQADAFQKAFLGRLGHPQSGQGADTVRASLRDGLTRFLLDPASAAFLVGEPRRPREMPDRGGDAALSEPAFGWVNRQLGEVGHAVFEGPGGCKFCHPNTPIPEAKIPRRWWQRATFAHAPHRMLDCAECHPKATTSKEASDVMLPDQASCIRCHHPGGARSDCAECHVYHGPEGRREGRDHKIDWLGRPDR